MLFTEMADYRQYHAEAKLSSSHRYTKGFLFNLGYACVKEPQKWGDCGMEGIYTSQLQNLSEKNQFSNNNQVNMAYTIKSYRSIFKKSLQRLMMHSGS